MWQDAAIIWIAFWLITIEIRLWFRVRNEDIVDLWRGQLDLSKNIGSVLNVVSTLSEYTIARFKDVYSKLPHKEPNDESNSQS